jgi:protein-S-isoprenylcysteine O-methyltransferase Ste14
VGAAGKAIAAFPVVMAVVVPAVVLAVFGAGGGLALGPSIHVASIAVGVLLVALGLALFCWTVVLFARRGKGALAPLGDTIRLVVSGPYRHVRNPMCYYVTGIVSGTDPRLKDGQTTRATVVTEEIVGVLTVPSAAVRQETAVAS